MEITVWFIAICGVSVLFAGISKGGFGSGAAFVSALILALAVPPGLALGIMLPMLMLIDALTLRPYWGQWRLRESVIMILGAIPGVALGAVFFASTDADVLRILIGVIALGFVVWQIARSRGWIDPTKSRPSEAMGLSMGIAAGFASFVSHAGGPPAAMYLLGRGMNKTEYQASSVLVFWAINIAKFFPYAALGLFTLETAKINVMMVPFAVLGAWLGVKAHHLVPERLFFGLTYVLLTVTGTKLIWDGVF